MEVKRIVDRLDGLISAGERVLSTRRPAPSGVIAPDSVDSALFEQWRTSSLAFLRTSLGSDSIHCRNFDERCKWPRHGEANMGLAILRAAKEDIEGGYLQRVEAIVSASVFSDFLEMAEHLLDNGYKDPAASLVGAVLEDGLRRVCGNNDITVKSDDNISSLNKKIADKGVYNRLQQREIEVWNKLRDYADHGKFDQYKLDDVKDMLKGVTGFLSDYLQ